MHFDSRFEFDYGYADDVECLASIDRICSHTSSNSTYAYRHWKTKKKTSWEYRWNLSCKYYSKYWKCHNYVHICKYNTELELIYIKIKSLLGTWISRLAASWRSHHSISTHKMPKSVGIYEGISPFFIQRGVTLRLKFYV